MRTVIFIPTLSWLSGGLANLYSVARALKNSGRQVALSSLSTTIPGLEQLCSEGFSLLPLTDIKLGPDDIWLVPESHPNALAPGLKQGARTIVYVQNWYYMLSAMPENVSWNKLPVEFLAVSKPVAWFMEQILKLKTMACLPPAITPEFFCGIKKEPATHIRVAFMPRKNQALARQMQELAAANLALHSKIPLEWRPLHRLNRQEIATELSAAHIFLSTGFPEGFGLPPLEAMACGCVPVGFTGFGGWEYMRQSDFADTPLPALKNFQVASPPFTIQDALPPNGFYVHDGDTLAGGCALAAAILTAHNNPTHWQELQAGGQAAASLYTVEKQTHGINKIWTELSPV